MPEFQLVAAADAPTAAAEGHAALSSVFTELESDGGKGTDMLTPSEFRRQFGPAERDRSMSEESGSGCAVSFLGASALAAVVLGASLGITKCGGMKEAPSGGEAITAPQQSPPDEVPLPRVDDIAP